MPYDKSGAPAHSFGRAKLQDDMNSNHTGAVSPKSRPAGKQPDPDAEMQESSPEDIKDVVQMNGPATEVTHKFDEASGQHHVHSKHGGVSHHSKHGSHAAAHAHIGKAMGVAAHEKEESPEYEKKEEGAMSIPGMG